MNASQKPPATPMSSEALVGIGITIAWLGLMCLLLGWAQYMRAVPKFALIWLALGLVLVVLGGFAAATARSRDRLRTRTDRFLSSRTPQVETESVAGPEEQRF